MCKNICNATRYVLNLYCEHLSPCVSTTPILVDGWLKSGVRRETPSNAQVHFKFASPFVVRYSGFFIR